MTVKKRTAPDRQVRGVVHSYWVERRLRREASRKPQATSHKLRGWVGPKAASHKAIDKPIDLWDKAI